MHKDRLILLLLLAGFFFAAACDHDDDEERRPDRAGAANPLLRHYFNTMTIPKNMTPIKIPEGDKFDDKELTLRFDMGGNEVVNEVRIRLFLITPPKLTAEATPDVEARVISPDGTRSAWQWVDFISPGGGDDDLALNPNAEVIYENAFTGVNSTGEWRIQLRDPIKDEDGRCVLRNATLRINGGLPAGSASGSTTATLALANGPYSLRLPERIAPRYVGDIGHFGVSGLMRLPFTVASNFAVRGIELQFTVRAAAGTDPNTEIWFCIVSPSGGWFLPAVDLVPLETLDESSGVINQTWLTYNISMSSTNPEIGGSFAFLGEPAQGVWNVLLWERAKDGNAIWLSPDEVQGGALSQNVAATLSLS